MTSADGEASGRRRRLALALLIVASTAVHALLVSLLRPATASATQRAVELEFYQLPQPPAPPRSDEPKPEVRVASKAPRPSRIEPTVRPPTNQTPPVQTAPVPLVVGINFDSTTTSGDFAVPVGNTTYGKATGRGNAAVLPAGASAGPELGEGADVEPQLIGDDIKVPYPETARRAQVEGTVRLKVLLDATGRVVKVSVVSGPGAGLNEAARGALEKFRFRPAQKDGRPVAYAFLYAYTFELK